jgi:hypothetical protein
LVLFLEGWHCSVRDKWVDIHGVLAQEVDCLRREQEVTVIRGMGLCNKIAGVLLGDKGAWEELYGTGMEQEEREAVRRCVFDMSDMVMKKGGGVDGEIKLDYHNPWGGCECEDCEEGNVMRDFGTQTERWFDSLYDYEEKGCQTEIQGDEKGTQTEMEDDDEKGRHDSEVGLEEEVTEGVKVGRLNIDEMEDGGAMRENECTA